MFSASCVLSECSSRIALDLNNDLTILYLQVSFHSLSLIDCFFIIFFIFIQVAVCHVSICNPVELLSQCTTFFIISFISNIFHSLSLIFSQFLSLKNQQIFNKNIEVILSISSH
jgi:hypothetical protein